jgi:hypothetical protein
VALFNREKAPQANGPYVVDRYEWGKVREPLQDWMNSRYQQGYELLHVNTIPASPLRGGPFDITILVWQADQ